MEDNKKSGCLCGVDEYMVLACSGACDLGQITDLVARKLRDNGVRKMNCLAVVGAGIEQSIEAFKSRNILMLDGCPTDCGKRILDRHGFTDYKYFRVTDLGYKKGQTPVTEEVVNKVYEKVEVIY
ncbi:MAG: putative zinc-binding protein [Tenuifilum sp.]|uniref:putative zinc-binding protein n=1 Tax=Tenuifilum sp. TaxID=2760880 RepID=UPI001B3DE18E|nr:putative zinc-binding protein [Bacteroidales bacterium]HOK60042.1 putative zinc-binding protein [Tenuifilum sp.]MBP9028402.1 putative zinc-binding protein [Bacteroidales bacterium]HOK84736.1 putative zinc-binding protein [Tenuifilum sp.]HON69744.1 putative zinc-binding protein [Tenuifilum sp.]